MQKHTTLIRYTKELSIPFEFEVNLNVRKIFLLTPLKRYFTYIEDEKFLSKTQCHMLEEYLEDLGRLDEVLLVFSKKEVERKRKQAQERRRG
jgi:hypothetical protein